MPYLDASAGDLRRVFGIADDDLPDAAVLVGVLSARNYGTYIGEIWPHARQLTEQIWSVEHDGRRIWHVQTFGAAMAATFAHLAARLGSRAIFQLGLIGGLQPGWAVGDILVPEAVIGRDGVSRQLSRSPTIHPDDGLTAALSRALTDAGEVVKPGTLVTTTTISFERPRDIARWARAGYAGVEMEAAATLAVAAHFGVPATSAFVLLDNLAADHTVFHVTDDDRRLVRQRREAMERAIPSVLASAT